MRRVLFFIAIALFPIGVLFGLVASQPENSAGLTVWTEVPNTSGQYKGLTLKEWQGNFPNAKSLPPDEVATKFFNTGFFVTFSIFSLTPLLLFFLVEKTNLVTKIKEMKNKMFIFALISLAGFIFGVYDSQPNRPTFGDGVTRSFDFGNFLLVWTISSTPLLIALIYKLTLNEKKD